MKSVLDSRQLLAARVLADTGSFTLAGQKLSLTQSAVSHAIKALEEEVECQLFHRSGRGVTVTPAGRHFLQHADTILLQMEAARTLVTPRTLRGRERLRIGAGDRLRQLLLPPVQALFQKDFPNRLAVIATDSNRLNLELLDAGLLDFSFTTRPDERPDLQFVPVFEDELRLVVAPMHPWAAEGRACLDDLARDTIVAFPQGSNIGRLIAWHLKLEKIIARHDVELPDAESIKSLVRTGCAAGVFSPWEIGKELHEGSLVALPIGSRRLLRQWGAVHLQKHGLVPMEKRFIEVCQSAVPELLGRSHGSVASSHQKKDAALVSEKVTAYSAAAQPA